MLIVLCGVLCLIFIGIQIWKGDAATVPPRIFMMRNIAASLWFGFFNGIALYVATYFLPIWFQAIRGVSALESGLMLLPLILSTVVGVLLSGVLVSKLGYYTPFFLLSSIFTPIGAGLLTTLTPETGHAKYISYQVILGLGMGCGGQQPLTVAQSVLSRADIASGTSLMIFGRFVGAAIMLPVAQTVFLNSLISKLDPNLHVSAASVTGGGATELRKLVSSSDLKTLLVDYNDALVNVFYLIVAACCLTIFGSLCVEWKSLKSIEKDQASKTEQETPVVTDEGTGEAVPVTGEKADEAGEAGVV